MLKQFLEICSVVVFLFSIGACAPSYHQNKKTYDSPNTNRSTSYMTVASTEQSNYDILKKFGQMVDMYSNEELQLIALPSGNLYEQQQMPNLPILQRNLVPIVEHAIASINSKRITIQAVGENFQENNLHVGIQSNINGVAVHQVSSIESSAGIANPVSIGGKEKEILLDEIMSGKAENGYISVVTTLSTVTFNPFIRKTINGCSVQVRVEFKRVEEKNSTGFSLIAFYDNSKITRFVQSSSEAIQIATEMSTMICLARWYHVPYWLIYQNNLSIDDIVIINAQRVFEMNEEKGEHYKNIAQLQKVIHLNGIETKMDGTFGSETQRNLATIFSKSHLSNFPASMKQDLMSGRIDPVSLAAFYMVGTQILTYINNQQLALQQQRRLIENCAVGSVCTIQPSIDNLAAYGASSM